MCWYYKNWKCGFTIFSKALTCSVFVIIFYSFIEIFYLTGNEIATNILIKITPYFHTINDIGSSNGKCQPLLLKSLQMRSIFVEPSYFGIYTGFCIPFIWCCLTEQKSKKKYIIYLGLLFILNIFIFLTQARTAIGIYFVEILMLLALVLFFEYTNLIKTSIIIFLSSLLALLFSNYFINNYINNSINSYNLVQYVDNNFLSLIDETRRSNPARYAYIKSAFRIGTDNMIFGVGRGMTPAYVTNYFTEEEKNIPEVHRRIERQKEVGILAANMPILCEYVKRFAEIGFIGMIIYFIPLFYLIFKLILKL